MKSVRILLLVIICSISQTWGATESAPPLSLAPIAATTNAIYEVKLTGAWGAKNMVLLLTADQGRWQRVWGYHQETTTGISHGYVTAAELTPQRARWNVVMQMTGDVFLKKGVFGRFVITAERSGPDAPWTGTYESRMDTDTPVRGKAEINSLPLPPRRPGATPLAAGEHPRLLFRKSDLPALRQRLATPFGQAAQAIFAASNDPAALGVLYQLTGDRQYADRAREPFEKELANEDFGMAGTGQVFGDRLLTVAVAWDCLRELWTDEFNRKVEDTLLARCELLFFAGAGQGYNAAPTSNWAGPRHAGAGMASLTMAGDPGDAPPLLGSRTGPQTSFGFQYNPLYVGIYRADLPLVVELPALTGKTAPEWSLGKPFPAWLWSGIIAVKFAGNQDLLSGLGGSAKAMPEEGTTCAGTVFTADGPTDIAIRFSKLPAELMSQNGLLATNLLAGGTADGNVVLSSTYQVRADTPVKCSPAQKGVKIWIDQTLLKEGAMYLLKAGTHRVLTTISIAADAIPTGRLDPQFVDASQELTPLHEALRLFGAHERGDWEAKGKPDFYKDYLVDVGRMRHYQYCWMGMGDGGFQAETGGYSHHGGRGIYSYALMHWNVFGRLVSGRGDIANYVPRHVFSNPVGEPSPMHYHKNSRLLGLPISGINQPCSVAYSRSFPFLKPAWQPAALWLWQQDLGIDPAKPETALKTDPLITFLTYPLDLVAQPPSTPTWPLTWASRYRGWYGFRNGYRGAAQDALVQVYTKSSPEMGWNHNNTATFTLQALGVAWAQGVYERGAFRTQMSVVQLPSVPDPSGGYGLVPHYQTEADGSVTLSIDLRHGYGEPITNRPPLIDKHGMFANGIQEPTGPITQGRFMSVDYSGKSGSPVVLVIVDRLDGLKDIKRHWQWMLPDHLHGATTYEPRSFTVTSNGATMRTTFAHPAQPDFKRPGEVSVTYRSFRGGSSVKVQTTSVPKNTTAGIEGLTGEIAGVDQQKRKQEEQEQAKLDAAGEQCPLMGIGVQGDDHFFTVTTIGPGTPPEVQIQGTGLSSVVRVGQRTYRFDGEKVVMEP